MKKNNTSMINGWDETNQDHWMTCVLMRRQCARSDLTSLVIRNQESVAVNLPHVRGALEASSVAPVFGHRPSLHDVVHLRDKGDKLVEAVFSFDEGHRTIVVLLVAHTACFVDVVHVTKVVLRQCIPFLGRLSEPLYCLDVVLLDTSSIAVHDTKAALCCWSVPPR